MFQSINQFSLLVQYSNSSWSQGLSKGLLHPLCSWQIFIKLLIGLEDWWRKVKTISERLTILTKRLFCRLWLSPGWWSPRWVSSALWFPPAPSLFWFENKGGTDGASAQRHPLVLVGGNVPGLRACTRGRDRKQGSRQWWQLRPGRPGSQAHSL